MQDRDRERERERERDPASNPPVCVIELVMHMREKVHRPFTGSSIFTLSVLTTPDLCRFS